MYEARRSSGNYNMGKYMLVEGRVLSGTSRGR